MALSSNSNDLSLVNYNGHLIPDNQSLLTADNRSFRYGDGLFETMLVSKGRIRLGHLHWDRLLGGMRQLQLTIPPFFTPDQLEQQILVLCGANGHIETCRVRLTVWREEVVSGNDSIGYIIQTGPAPAEWNEEGLAIDVFQGGYKSADPLSALKSNNYLLYVLAGRYAREQRLDDCLVLNSHGRLADSTIANLFYIKNSIIYTPPLTEGCVAGVMRRHLLEVLPKAGFTVCEQAVSPEDLQSADEVFLTNALRGIRWVRFFQGVTYINRQTSLIYHQLTTTL